MHGYFSILYSRRPLVTNYLEAVNKPVCSLPCHYDLIEQTRDERMPIYKIEWVRISLVKCQSIHYRKCQIPDVGMHRFRIDSLFFDDDWTVEIFQVYIIWLYKVLKLQMMNQVIVDIGRDN